MVAVAEAAVVERWHMVIMNAPDGTLTFLATNGTGNGITAADPVALAEAVKLDQGVFSGQTDFVQLTFDLPYVIGQTMRTGKKHRLTAFSTDERDQFWDAYAS